jgi:hypothetical protein
MTTVMIQMMRMITKSNSIVKVYIILVLNNIYDCDLSYNI